jgi:hypothetical protein
MHGRLDRSGRNDSAGYSSVRLIVIPALLLVALVVLAIEQPDASRWISEAVQAEFANTSPAPETAAPPAREIRTVRAN